MGCALRYTTTTEYSHPGNTDDPRLPAVPDPAKRATLMADQHIPVLQLVDGFATEERSGGASLFGIQLARHLDRGLFAPHICGLWRYNTASEQRWLAQLR